MTNPIGWCDDTINPFTGCRNGCWPQEMSEPSK